MINCSVGEESSTLVSLIFSISVTPLNDNESISNLFLIEFMLRSAIIILFGFLMQGFLNLNMSSPGCSTDNFTESDLKLESNSS